jgi:hypothetical protein
MKLGAAQSETLKRHRKNSSMIDKLTQHTKENQEHGLHCDLWVQQLASSKSFKNNSTTSNHLQWKKYAGFSKLLDGKVKQQIVAIVAEKLPSQLHVPSQEIKRLIEDPLF